MHGSPLWPTDYCLKPTRSNYRRRRINGTLVNQVRPGADPRRWGGGEGRWPPPPGKNGNVNFAFFLNKMKILFGTLIQHNIYTISKMSKFSQSLRSLGKFRKNGNVNFAGFFATNKNENIIWYFDTT